jgi:hypothetical protein
MVGCCRAGVKRGSLCGNGILSALRPCPPRHDTIPSMSKKSNPPADEVQAAVRAGQEIISRHEQALPADLEAAWKAWSAGVGKVDARGMALLRAAFEAGAEAAGNRR